MKQTSKNWRSHRFSRPLEEYPLECECGFRTKTKQDLHKHQTQAHDLKIGRKAETLKIIEAKYGKGETP